MPELAFVPLVNVQDDLKYIDVLEQGTCSAVFVLVISKWLVISTLSTVALLCLHAKITSTEVLRCLASRFHFRDQGDGCAFCQADVLLRQELRVGFQQLLDDLLALGRT